MTVAVRAMTADELWAMPQEDDSVLYELVNGELVTMSPAGADHGDVAISVALSLGSYVRERRLGKIYAAETGFVLRHNPDTVLGPDVAFVRAERVVKTKKFFDGPPDLAVEVRSPYDRRGHIDVKVRHYLAAGTSMVIIIDPDKQTAAVHTPTAVTHLTAADVIDGGEVVPGWRLPLRELFE